MNAEHKKAEDVANESLSDKSGALMFNLYMSRLLENEFFDADADSSTWHTVQKRTHKELQYRISGKSIGLDTQMEIRFPLREFPDDHSDLPKFILEKYDHDPSSPGWQIKVYADRVDAEAKNPEVKSAVLPEALDVLMKWTQISEDS